MYMSMYIIYKYTRKRALAHKILIPVMGLRYHWITNFNRYPVHQTDPIFIWRSASIFAVAAAAAIHPLSYICGALVWTSMQRRGSRTIFIFYLVPREHTCVHRTATDPKVSFHSAQLSKLQHNLSNFCPNHRAHARFLSASPAVAGIKLIRFWDN